ncbi:MAG: hypothetical protein ACLTWO_09455 [Blautia massiliensis (ex Durand et al. 2017)]
MRRLWFWIRLAVVVGMSVVAVLEVLGDRRRTSVAGGSPSESVPQETAGTEG